VKYPKEWWSVLNKHNCDYPTDALDELNELGALRSPPKRREFWECSNCGQRVGDTYLCLGVDTKTMEHTGCGKMIHYIEASDD
jgi:hypothetical protein